MSKNLNLVKYKSDGNGNLYEEGYETVDFVFISSDLISELENDFSLASLNIFEDNNLDDSYEIDIFPVEKTVEIHSKLEELFVDVLRHEAKGYTESNSISDSKEIGYKKDIDISLSIDRFRTITNVIYLVKLKKDKFLEDSSVVLKLG